MVLILITLKTGLALNNKSNEHLIVCALAADWQIPILEKLFTLLEAESYDYSPIENGEEILEPAPNKIRLWKQLKFKAICRYWIGDDKANEILSSLGGFTCSFNIEKLKPYDLSQPIIQPIHINKKLVILSGALKKVTYPKKVKIVKINQGVAFGTGSHPTTQLILKAICNYDLNEKTILDYGCGSGILGISSLLLDANHCTFIDIEPQALTSTKENLDLNLLKNNHEIGFPEKLKFKKFDVIMINIIANTIIASAPTLIKLLNPNGLIFISGILIPQTKKITEAFHDFSLLSQANQEGWSQLALSNTHA